MKRILAIHAHPDDVEFQCAGTLALLAQRGHHLTIATMTPGDCGSAELGPEEIGFVRREEARRCLLDQLDPPTMEFRVDAPWIIDWRTFGSTPSVIDV